MKKLILFILPFILACPKNPDLPTMLPEVAPDKRFEMTTFVYSEEDEEWFTITMCAHPDPELPAVYWPAHCRPIITSKEKPVFAP